MDKIKNLALALFFMGTFNAYAAEEPQYEEYQQEQTEEHEPQYENEQHEFAEHE